MRLHASSHNSLLREINFNDRGSYITISLLPIRHSIEIYYTFMDYNPMEA